jgi:hypothetical protein
METQIMTENDYSQTRGRPYAAVEMTDDGFSAEDGRGADVQLRKSTSLDETEKSDYSPRQRHARRLPDEILMAFHHACDQREIKVAGQLLDVLEFMIKRILPLQNGEERRAVGSLVAAQERLWQIRHPAPDK